MKVRIFAIHSVDLLELSVRHFFIRIKAPGAAEETLTSEHLVKSRDTALEVVRGIEEYGVGALVSDKA